MPELARIDRWCCLDYVIDPMSYITLRLRELREVRGWSQAELARRAGLQRVTITLIEGHRTKGVDFDTLEKLARALEVDPAYLIVTRAR
jgi:transcriptional regulator with XRE-family HTH domain